MQKKEKSLSLIFQNKVGGEGGSSIRALRRWVFNPVPSLADVALKGTHALAPDMVRNNVEAAMVEFVELATPPVKYV